MTSSVSSVERAAELTLAVMTRTSWSASCDALGGQRAGSKGAPKST